MGNRKPVIIVGGGVAGLVAAYTLKKRGINVILFEENDRAGGRLRGDQVDGFYIDEGADFFCSSYDVVFRMCEELNLPLVRSVMKLGWYRNEKWIVSSPIYSLGSAIRRLTALWKLGFITPRSIRPMIRIARSIKEESEYLNFSSGSRIVELDGECDAGAYMDSVGVPESLRVTFRGFLEMTMGDVESMGSAYMRTYLAEMLIKADQIYVPEKGAGALAHALIDACGEIVHVSKPVLKVVVTDGVATGVVLEDGFVEADAVICATPATAVPRIIPELPYEIRYTLENVSYSRGCRVVIGLDRPPLPPGWNGALYPEDDTPLLLDRSINLPACVPPGKSTLDLLVGRERAEQLFSLDDDQIKRQMLHDARRRPPPRSNLPADDEGLFTRVYRWKEAVCMGRPHMFKEIDKVRHQLNKEVINLFLAGDYMRVPSVNGAMASGIGVAKQAAEWLASGNE